MAKSDYVTSSDNPYTNFYDAGFGTIIGKPMSFNRRADPNQRIFQETLLRNNTIVRIVPGKYHFQKEKLEVAKKYLEDHAKKSNELKAKAREALSGGGNYRNITKDLAKLNNETQAKLISEKIDMRYLTFEPAFTEFLSAFQLVSNRAGTSIFGKTGTSTINKFSTNIMDALLNTSIQQSAEYRGFNLWVEKSTSISESISNTFTNSVFEGMTNKISRAANELSNVLGLNFGSNMESTEAKQVETASGVALEESQIIGKVSQYAGQALSGSKVILPQIWEDSKFDRSYNISFRYVSPGGDDRSVYMNVILPFLFTLSCAMPTQDGPSGMKYPFLVQMDCPGYFSCPMGVITSMTFTKGGSDALFNRSGLPLVIEGTLSVMDLYSSLSLPVTDSQFITNLGTSAFINNLVGATLYSTMDQTLSVQMQNYVKGGLLKFTTPINQLNESHLNLLRWAGLADSKTTGFGR